MGRKGKWFGAVKKVFSSDSKKKKLKNKDSDPPSSEFQESTTLRPPSSNPHHEEENEHSYSVAVSSAVVSHTAFPRFAGKSEEEIAAIKIQTAFRGYLARRALRALRGLVRLKSLIHCNSVKRQATTALHCMQTLSRVQSQIRSRRIRMSEENQTLQRQLFLKREKELESLRMGEEWNDSLQSKQQIVASMLSKQEASLRRERALAYAFTRQGKNSSRSANPMFMDASNPHWGWSWVERWMAARPWESDRASVKKSTVVLERASQKTKKSFRHSPSTPDDDARSVKSEFRRHSIAGSSAGDEESLVSSPAVPSYMAPTRSTRSRSRFQSPSSDTIEGLDKVSVGSTKKRLSFPAPPVVTRRHSGPPKVELAKMNDVAVQLQ